jgi:hypothetical protein
MGYDDVRRSQVTDKSEKFRRVAERRTNAVLESLRVLGNCSNRSTYEYDEAEVRKIFSAIERELRDTKAKFQAGNRQRFTLD